MTYDGAEFTVSTISLIGANLPRNEALMSTTQIRTGQPIIITPGHEPRSTVPWIIAAGERLPEVQCLFFDGIHLKNPGHYDPEASLAYLNPNTGERGIQTAKHEHFVYAEIQPWISANPDNQSVLST